MNYSIYKNVRNASWHCLIDCNIKSLPIKINDVIKPYNGKVLFDSKYHELKDGQSGKVIVIDGNPIIFVNDLETIERQRFTAMHELGHFLLGHLTMYPDGLLRAPLRYKPEEETAADVFAARILAPSCVLWGLNLHSAEEISKACRISYTAAEIRAERMELLYQRNKFLTSPLEKELYKRFEDFIRENKKSSSAPDGE